MICVKFTAFCDFRADLRIRLATHRKSARNFWFCKLKLLCVDLRVRLARAIHMHSQLMWIESVLGHSFLTCNLLWPCFLIETSDTELSGIHLTKRKVSYLKSGLSHLSGEKQKRWKDTTRRAHAIAIRA